jgi:DHA1 family bicyclomycin/chloramphenicol resistance-like MFS transporter
MTIATAAGRTDATGPSLPALITVIASMMGLAALSIDIMLPALPAISDSFGLADPNQRQLVITFYLFGFAAGQLLYGPLSDSFGRKPVLIVGLAIYAAASLATYLATDYSMLLLARAVQGIGCAAPRIIALAVVRDLYSGRQMARVMSFVMMVFIIVPVIAPSIGEGLLLIGDWRWIFLFLLLASGAILILTAWRLPETRPVEQRAPMSLQWLKHAIWRVVSTRQTLGYTIATGFIFGCLMSYINSAQQILEGIYGLDELFPVVFGAIAIALAGASVTNGALVRQHGMRRLSHSALIGFVLVAAIHAIVAISSVGPPPIAVFAGFLAVNLFLFGFLMPNFNAIAMEPLREIAGTGSSFIGFFTTGSAAILGWLVGQSFDDTVVPLTIGYVVLSAIALIVVTVTERGRLFRAVTGP